MKKIKLRIASAVMTACMIMSSGMFTAKIEKNDTVIADEYCDGCNSVSSITHGVNEEKINGFVTRLYEVCLGRTPDAAGLKSWADTLINDEATGICVAYGFVFSNEFQSKEMSNEEYVKCMYRAFLGRDADADGLAAWTKAMDDGASRQQIFKGFAMSPEFSMICDDYGVFRGDYYIGVDAVQASQVNLFVRRLYEDVLGRECDYSGLEAWSLVLIKKEATGIKTAEGFYNSSEFKERNLCNNCYVDSLYHSFLGRNPSDDERTTWTDALAKNSRAKIFEGFAESTEFTNICEKYGIVRGNIENKIKATDIDKGIFTDTSTRNNIDLVIWVINAYNQRWGYRYASYGNVDNGRRYADCSGLIKSYFWYNFETGAMKPNSNGFTQASSEVMWAEAKVKGNMSTMPDTPGLGLWRPGHVAVYIGNGLFVDSANSSIGMRMSTMRAIDWQGWFEIKGLTYIHDEKIPEFDFRGSNIYFGQYGGEVISWTIVDKKDDNLLLVANNVIDVVPYDDAEKDTTWDRSSLRTWLNDEFYENAFNDGEKSLIQTTTLEPERNTKYNYSVGSTTKDKIYILSATDAEKYFKEYSSLKVCNPTAYASSRSGGEIISNYWLRTPTQSNVHNASTVASLKGDIDYSGNKGEATNVGVRPMMWIKTA